MWLHDYDFFSYPIPPSCVKVWHIVAVFGGYLALLIGLGLVAYYWV